MNIRLSIAVIKFSFCNYFAAQNSFPRKCIILVWLARYGISPKGSASLLDTFSCIFQGIIPYGAQMLVAIYPRLRHQCL